MRRLIPVLLFITASVFPLSVSHGESIKEQTFQRLDKIRQDKKGQLYQYLEKITKNAHAISTDEFMLEFFHIKKKYYRLKKSSPPPKALKQLIEDLKKGVRSRYLQHYLSFYDILFVDGDGDIFHTIRRQADYHKNIFEGELAKTSLARQLTKHPGETFVDYEYYAVSDEPSAFLVEPVFKEGGLEGWFVLQCAINKINNMFTEEKNLGATGEVFLVNRHQYMLTESRFSKESSILNRHLSRENIEAKFREGSGHKIVTDYRGVRALTSFEVCNIGASEWLLIAKIDEAEIITEQYHKKRKELSSVMAESLTKQKPKPCAPMRIESKVVSVDMDEFRKVENNEMICTYGVSTCTALIVTFPGKFAYLGHISNLDVVYGGDSTDLIGHMFKRIKTFDIYAYERRKLVVSVVANHLDSIMNIIDKLIGQGILLSQIKFIYADSEYGNVLHDYSNNRTLVEWRMERENGAKRNQCASSVQAVGEMIKPLIGYR
ncbi:MAG: cache domain-containing protein [Deltaproteobacteria bacterium]|nr:cache domain-containing protein [Deltaproteobacteria bacterium]